MAQGTHNQMVTQDKWYSALQIKDIEQAIIERNVEDARLQALMSPDTVLNGIKQYIDRGLIDGKRLDESLDFSASDLNPGLPRIDDLYIKADRLREYTTQMPNINVVQAFQNKQKLREFQMGLENSLFQSQNKDVFYERMNAILTGNMKDLVANRTNSTYTYDKDKKDMVDWTSTNNILTGLEIMRTDISSFGTLSKQHTAYSRNDLGGNFYAKYKAKDFVVVWSHKYYSKLATVKAQIFNKEDPLLNVAEQMVYNFDLVEGLTNAEKTAAGKTICVMVHKKALKEIILQQPTKIAIDTIKHKTVFSLAFYYGAARLPFYPIYKYSIA